MSRRSLSPLALLTAVSTLVTPAARAQSAEREVRTVRNLPAVAEAFRIIDETDRQTVADLIALTEIPAPPFMEEARARRFADLLRAAGIDSVWIDEAGNVLAWRPGRTGTRTVAFDAHLDTVFPEGTDVRVRVDGDTLRAPGISDDTRGLSLVLAVVRALNGANLETDANILVVGSVGEEGLGDLRGVKHLFRPGGPRIDSWVGIDGISTTSITHRGLGSHRYRVTFRGPGGHSWGAFGLGNPHHALGEAIHQFVELAAPFTADGPRTSYNVGRIGGGTSVNSIPFESWMEVDMRSVSPERLIRIDTLLQQSIRGALDRANELRRQGEPLSVDVNMIGERPSGAIAAESPLVQRAMAVTRLMGDTPRLRIGSTNANIPISLGIPAVTIGAGGAGAGAHSLGEWWVNDNGPMGIKRALLLLVTEAGPTDLIN